jgi:RNA polymerase sigma-70 factor (ECF subfamily)
MALLLPFLKPLAVSVVNSSVSMLTNQGGATAWSPDRGLCEGGRVEETPDRLLVRSARQGDVAACQELIRRYQDRVYAVAYSFVQDREEALDITQDTFLKMLDGLPRFREQANIYTWLYRIVVNRCIDWRRRRMRHPPPVSLDDLAAAEGIEPANPHAAQLPHAALEAKELREQISQAIAAVREPYRMVVMMADVQGLTVSEIAQILHCPVNTVKTRLHRGRIAIRDRLGPYLKGEEL